MKKLGLNEQPNDTLSVTANDIRKRSDELKFVKTRLTESKKEARGLR